MSKSVAEALESAGFTHARNDEDGVAFWEKESTTVAVDPVENVALISRYSTFTGQRNMFTRVIDADKQSEHIALIASR